jgi:hypothetical protein
VFYVSNVLDYLWEDRGSAQPFFENARTLPVSATSVIVGGNGTIGSRCAMSGWITAGWQAQSQAIHLQRLRADSACSR